VLAPGANPEDVVVIACERGRHCVVIDQPLPCRVVLFDWSGEGIIAGSNPHGFDEISVPTECKGHLIEEAWRRLEPPAPGHYMGFIDDDVLLRSSDLHTLLAVSFTSSLHRVPIVEIMAPFIRRDLLELAMPFLQGLRSGYGFDRFALPLWAYQLNAWRFAAVDLIPLNHVRNISSLQKRFSNGLLSKQEELLIRQRLVLAMGMETN
jgi:hypothetical protein